ncbi:MAG: RNA-directed DNA polymerase [Phaeodactylibacter sp.]|uniref:RNA-directed DNA polymerase n=1 Tax=Phaeodactylibacter sp. TaxID=1940289 RepID=UPI0032EF1746
MRRVNNLLAVISDMDNLRLAFWKASKGKRYSASVLDYQSRLEEHLWSLKKAIENGIVEVGDYRYFFVFEPKKREICASAFREQVLHHALMNSCHAYFDRAQIFDSYASRKGKGTYAALDRAKVYNREYEWYLKLDVRKFFASIQHTVLKKQLARLFKEERLLSILYQIIDSYEASSGCGLPIGNLTSQYFANHYLSGLDHYIKERLRIKAYIRYMDDMVLWDSDKAKLLDAHASITTFCNEQLQIVLKPMQLNKTNQGLPLLGYRLFPYHVRLLRKSKLRFIEKAGKIYLAKGLGIWGDKTCQRKMLPLLAFIDYSDSRAFRKSVISTLEGQVS